MKCRLCGVVLTSSNKCNAHIFPASLLRLLSAKEYGQLKIVGTEMDRAKKKPIGSYDDSILCSPCDGKIGIYDKYAKKFVVTSKLVPHPIAGWTISGVDQHKLKMFCLSYLWRASITRLPEFNGVSLGDLHEEKLRKMILLDDSGTPSDFTTSIRKFESRGSQFGAILFPARTRIRGLTHYEAYLPDGYKVWVKVDSRNDPMIDALSIGAIEPMYVGNHGDFDSSIEKKIMVQAAQRSK